MAPNTPRQISRSDEYVENECPNEGLLHPVLSSESFMKLRISACNRILFFLAVSTIACLGALVLSPTPIVRGAAAAIWLGSYKFAEQMLRRVSKKS